MGQTIPPPLPDPATESSSLPDPTPTPPPLPPVLPSAPRFLPWVTILYSILTIAGLIGFFYLTYSQDPPLQSPEMYLNCVMGRNLDGEEYASVAPPWQQVLNYYPDEPQPDRVLGEVISAYEEMIQKNPSIPLKRTLMILLAESGQMDKASTLLRELEFAGEPAEEKFVDMVKAAYFGTLSSNPAVKSEAMADLSPEWIHDKLAFRLAEKHGDPRGSATARSRTLERGRTFQDRVSLLVVIHYLMAGIGLFVILVWATRRGFPKRQTDHGMVVAPWRFRELYAVVVRSMPLGFVMAMGCYAFLEVILAMSRFLPAGNSLGSWGSSTALFVAIAQLGFYAPFQWLAWRHLLRPHQLRLQTCFNIWGKGLKWKDLFYMTVAFTAIANLGELILGLLIGHGLEIQPPTLIEQVPEEILSAWPEFSITIFSVVILAPILEEIGFRGFFYTTLRRVASPWRAAFLTSIIFSLMHGYSLTGFVMILWSGVVCATAYEKSRSLTVCMLIHAINNLWVTIYGLMLYRF